MKISPAAIPGVLIIEPKRIPDPRGFFCETWRRDLFEKAVGHPVIWQQDNESVSAAGVLRGLHFQKADAAQGKLVRVISGKVADVAVDLRLGSPTFGRHIIISLDDSSARQVWLPRGIAHGFVVLDGPARFQYKIDAPYRPDTEATLRFDDPALGIAWPSSDAPLLLSPKDLNGRLLADFAPEELPHG